MGLDIVEMVFAVEEAFDVEISNADAAQIETVGDLYVWLRTHLPASANDAPLGAVPAGPIWERLLHVIAEDTGVARTRLVPEARR